MATKKSEPFGVAASDPEPFGTTNTPADFQTAPSADGQATAVSSDATETTEASLKAEIASLRARLAKTDLLTSSAGLATVVVALSFCFIADHAPCLPDFLVHLMCVPLLATVLVSLGLKTSSCKCSTGTKVAVHAFPVAGLLMRLIGVIATIGIFFHFPAFFWRSRSWEVVWRLIAIKALARLSGAGLRKITTHAAEVAEVEPSQLSICSLVKRVAKCGVCAFKCGRCIVTRVFYAVVQFFRDMHERARQRREAHRALRAAMVAAAQQEMAQAAAREAAAREAACWNCSACTFRNQGPATACAVCEKPRGVVAPHPVAPAVPATHVAPSEDASASPVVSAATNTSDSVDELSSWACAYCTFENPTSVSACQMCTGPRPSA